MFSIFFCRFNDTDNLMKYISDSWAKYHILANDKKFFNWQHFDKVKKIQFCYCKKKIELLVVMVSLATVNTQKN